MKVAFLGLGAMGRPMAANLATAFDTVLWNRTPQVAVDLADATRGRACQTLTAVAESAPDVVATCLPTTVEVAAVAEELAPHLAADTVWVDHTSGDPAATRALAQALASRGIQLLDAPVSGGTDGAEAGSLAIMVGGEAATLERVRDVLAAVGRHIVHVGPIGTGMAVKAVNNALLATSLRAAAEGLVALKAAGVPTPTALEVINASSGRSFATERLIPERVVDRSFPRTFALSLLTKDVGLARTVLEEGEVDGQVLRHVHELLLEALAQLGAEADHVELVRVVEELAGQRLE